MLALTTTPQEPFATLTEVPEPQPLPGEAVVAVEACSLNRGEVRQLARRPQGSIGGWDLAGTVLHAAADGSGPAEGTRVVGVVNPGAWAQRVAVPTSALGVLPDAVSFEQASTLPVAGLTALHALEIIGFVLGKRLAVTGASGGVGRFALQLARDAGAHVTAVARRQAGLRELGAADVVAALEPEGERFDGIVEGVGGSVLGAAIQRVRSRGTVVSFASTLDEPTSFPTRSFFGGATGANLHGLFIFEELARTGSAGRDLERLAGRVADGRLDCQIDLVAGWSDAPDAFAALLDGKVAGKAVLLVD